MAKKRSESILENINESFVRFLEKSPFEDWIWALLTFIVGVFIVRLIDFIARIFIHRVVPEKHAPMLVKIIRYAAYTVVMIIALSRAGVDLSVLLGAAGILTVAIGFASQTSASNVISGLFLVGERPFVVGDIIRVDTIVGVVETIDFVSVKLRTFDNLYARIPNETIFKSTIVNHTHYPIRRIDFEFPLAPEADLERLRTRMLERVQRIPTVLDEPAIDMQLLGFLPAGVHVRFCAWTTRAQFRETRTLVCLELIHALKDEEILLPGTRQQVFFESDKALRDALTIREDKLPDVGIPPPTHPSSL